MPAKQEMFTGPGETAGWLYGPREGVGLTIFGEFEGEIVLQTRFNEGVPMEMHDRDGRPYVFTTSANLILECSGDREQEFTLVSSDNFKGSAFVRIGY